MVTLRSQVPGHRRAPLVPVAVTVTVAACAAERHHMAPAAHPGTAQRAVRGVRDHRDHRGPQCCWPGHRVVLGVGIAVHDPQ